MELEFINQEITEARLLRSTGNFRSLEGKDITKLLYLNTLITYLLSKDNTQSVFAIEYAKQTTQYPTYSLFRTHATDMYILAYGVLHPTSDSLHFRNPVDSKKYLQNIQFNQVKHRKFIRRIASGAIIGSTEAMAYLYRLERQLKIDDSRYKRWRRLILDWENLKYPQKQAVTAAAIQEIRRIGKGSGSELIPSLTGMLKYKKYKDKAKDPMAPEEPSKLKRAAATAAGALAGRALANKLNGLDAKHAKNIGTGLGAIAGFWASGRQRK